MYDFIKMHVICDVLCSVKRHLNALCCSHLFILQREKCVSAGRRITSTQSTAAPAAKASGSGDWVLLLDEEDREKEDW